MIIFKNRIIKTNTLKLLGFGDEAIVYKYQDYALKIYREKPQKDILSYEEIEKLKQIRTKRILLPRETCFKVRMEDNIVLGGYATNLVSNIVDYQNLGTFLTKKLEEEKKAILSDLETFNEHNILMFDLSGYQNFLYNVNQEMYFVDAGSFKIKKCDYNYKRNLNELNNALHNHVMLLGEGDYSLKLEFCRIMKTKRQDINLKLCKLIKNIYDDTYIYSENYDTYFDFLKDIINEYGSVDAYKKHLIYKALAYPDNIYGEALEDLARVLKK